MSPFVLTVVSIGTLLFNRCTSTLPTKLDVNNAQNLLENKIVEKLCVKNTTCFLCNTVFDKMFGQMLLFLSIFRKTREIVIFRFEVNYEHLFGTGVTFHVICDLI